MLRGQKLGGQGRASQGGSSREALPGLQPLPDAGEPWRPLKGSMQKESWHQKGPSHFPGVSEVSAAHLVGVVLYRVEDERAECDAGVCDGAVAEGRAGSSVSVSSLRGQAEWVRRPSSCCTHTAST